MALNAAASDFDLMTHEHQARQFWNDYIARSGSRGGHFSIVRFGDTAELADELAQLVLTGVKRAHASLPRDFVREGRRMPRRGDVSVVVDGAGLPCCVIRCVAVDVKRMCDVDERFAWEAGGGDRTLQWWMAAHGRYFRRQGAREGFSVNADTELVLECFEVVWPAEYANDRRRMGGKRSRQTQL